MWTPEEWSDSMQDFNTRSGAVESIVVKRISVSENAQGIREPGTYVVADYEATYERIPFQCGYLIWSQTQEHNFVILREDSKYITAEGPGSISSSQLAQFKEQLGCTR